MATTGPTDAGAPSVQGDLGTGTPPGPDPSRAAVGPEDLVRSADLAGLAVSVSDPRLADDPLVWVNAGFEQLTGYRSQEVLGRNSRFLQGPNTDPASVRRIRAALDAGHAVGDTLLNQRADGSVFWNQLVVVPVVDGTGTVIRHVGIHLDVTDRVREKQDDDAATREARTSEERLQLLAEVSETLARHLDYTEAVRALATVVVPRLATWGYVAVTTDDGHVDRLHIATRDPRRRRAARLLEEAEPSWLAQSPPVRRALASESNHVATPFEIDAPDVATRTTTTQNALLNELGLGSALVVPLRGRDRVLGVLTLVEPEPGAVDRDAVVTANHIGYRAGLGLDNVRLYQREREAALTLQRSLLPEVPDLPGLDVAASYLPAGRRAQVGGDWFDVLPLPDGSVGLAVGDVVGHDLAAAAAMGQLRSVLRSYAWAGDGAGRVVARLDELVQGLGMADISTCVYLRLEGGVLRWCRAGHPPPLVRLPGGHVEALEDGLTTPIGVENTRAGVVEASRDLPVGALLVIYTDGLAERRDRSLRHGIDELTRVVAELPDGTTATEARDRLLARLRGPVPEDDMCLLVVRRVT